MKALLAALALIASHGVAGAQERARHALGEFEYAVASNGVLIAAPHGTSDANTPPIAIEAAKRAGAGYIVAWRFFADKVRINVNRPTEGAFLPCAQESPSERAQSVYGTYSSIVDRAAGGTPLRLYVEIHGNSNPNTAHNIEVATVGLSAAEVQALKDAYPAVLAQLREGAPDFPELALLIEPADRITYTAACAKKLGVFSRVPRGVHFEFPRSARGRNTIPGAALIVAETVRRLQEK